MKKLHLLALSMLLMTGIAQAYQSNEDNQGGSRRRGGRSQDKDKPEFEKISKKDLEKEIGGSLSFDRISDYAESFAQDIRTLSKESTPEQVQPVMKKGRIINQAVMQLLPAPKGKEQQSTSGDKKRPLPDSGKGSMSGGPKRGKKAPRPVEMEEQLDVQE